jgi:hypothetical protein
MAREQIGGHSCRWNREAKPALIGPLLPPILLQKERICEVSSMGGETASKVVERKYVRVVLDGMPIQEIEGIPIRRDVGLPEFPGGELWPGSEASHWG